MSYSDQTREGTVYLVLKPGRGAFELRVDKATNQKPRSTPEGSIVMKAKIKIPRKAFEPLAPEAVITVPEEMVQHPISVEAVDPT